MTSITFPLKRFPGQTGTLNIYFGGRLFVQPLILVITAPTTFIIYSSLASDFVISYRLVGLLPFIWGVISTALHLAESLHCEDNLFELPLDELKRVFLMEKGFYKRVIVVGVLVSVASTTVGAYTYFEYADASLFMISLESIVALQLLFGSVTRGLFGRRGITSYLSLAILSDLITFWAASQGQNLIALVVFLFSMSRLIVALSDIESYSLNRFFQKLIQR